MLGVHIDSKLNFYLHIYFVYKPASSQLKALVWLERSIGHEKRFVFVNNFIHSNFNCCPFVWMFLSKRSLNKIENLRKRALRFVLDDYTFFFIYIKHIARYQTEIFLIFFLNFYLFPFFNSLIRFNTNNRQHFLKNRDRKAF